MTSSPAEDPRRKKGPPTAAPTHHRGRRSGKPDTRRAILDAARACFATNGLARCSVRSIAAAAGVDPALIYHYFGSKQKLFLATAAVPINPAEIVSAVAAGPVSELGLRLTSAALSAWESPAGDSLIAVARASIADAQVGAAVQEFLATQLLAVVLDAAGCPAHERALRGSLVASQLVGALLGRHVLKFEPLASLPLSALIPPIGATVQRYLTGPLRS